MSVPSKASAKACPCEQLGTGSCDCILMATAEVVLGAGLLMGLAPKGSILKTLHLKMVLVKSICYDVKVSLNTVPEKGRGIAEMLFIPYRHGLTVTFVSCYAGDGSFKAER